MAGDTARLDHRRVRGHAGPVRLPAGLHRRRAVVRRVRARCVPRNPAGSSAAPAGILLALRARLRPGRRAARRRDPRERPGGARLQAASRADRPRHRRCSTGCSARRSARRSASGIVWILAAVVAQTPGEEQLRADIQRSGILRELNGAAAAVGADPERARAPGPAAVDRRPLAGRRGAAAAVARAPGRERAPRAASCACSAPPAGWRSRARAGSRAGMVVTNAHVVAGEQDTTVEVGGNSPAPARAGDRLRPDRRHRGAARPGPRRCPR